MKSKIIQSDILSDGKKVTLYKFGHKYSVMLSYAGDFDKPDLHSDLDKNTALKIYADYIESDMFELI